MNLYHVLTVSILIMSIATGDGAPSGRETTGCTPSFQEVSDKTIEARASYWRLYFSVALVGCREDLQSLTAGELDRVKEEFTNPTQWPILLLATDSKKQSFRDKARATVNALLGREVAADFLIHDLTIVDHNVTLGAGRFGGAPDAPPCRAPRDNAKSSQTPAQMTSPIPHPED